MELKYLRYKINFIRFMNDGTIDPKIVKYRSNNEPSSYSDNLIEIIFTYGLIKELKD